MGLSSLLRFVASIAAKVEDSGGITVTFDHGAVGQTRLSDIDASVSIPHLVASSSAGSANTSYQIQIECLPT